MMSTTFLEAFESECHWDSNDLSVAAEELDSTFKKARMKLGQIRSAAEKRLVDRSEESARHSCQKLHYELMKLLNNVGFLLTSPMAGKLHTNVEFVRSIVQNLKGIILDAGLLHSEPLFKRCDITEESTVVILFITLMNIQMFCVAALAVLQKITKKDRIEIPIKILQSYSAETETLNMSTQYYLVLLCDWFALNLGETPHSLIKLNLSMTNTLQHWNRESRFFIELSFWKAQTSIIKDFVNGSKLEKQPSFNCLFQLPFIVAANVSDPLQLLWNYIDLLIRAKKPDKEVERSEAELLLVELINFTVTSVTDVSQSEAFLERKLRKILAKLIGILMMLDGVHDYRLIKPIWKLFYDRLNAVHLCRDSELSLTIDSPGSDWCGAVENLSNRQWLANLLNMSQKCSGYELFLMIVGSLLAKDREGNPVIRQFKSQLCLNLHQRKMRELTDEGFFNLLMLFLVLHYNQELELSRFQDIIVLSDIKLDSYQKTGLLFRFYASYISVSDSRGQNFADCASHMRNSYEKLATTVHSTESRLDLVKQKQLSHALMHYIDGVKFILSKLNGDFNPSLQMLIGVSYDWMNTRMKDSMADSVVSETLRMLEYFSCLLDRLCKSSAADVKSTQQTLMNIISLLNIMAISPTLSEEMAESLAGCLWLLSRLHQSHRQIFPHLKDPLDDVISGQFCHNSVVSCYLATLLADGNNVKLLERRESKIGVTLVRLWFICALNSEDEEWLERTARLLPQISLLSEMGIVADDFKYKRTVAEVACVLFSALNSRVDENRDAELKAFVNSTFEFIPDLVAKLWKLPKAKPLELALSLCGQLVFNCTALIHQQGNSALLLPRILMKVFLSNANYKNDKLTEAQVAALRVSLPLIIQGLCKLNPTDEFVKRILGDLFKLYMYKFAKNSSSRSLNDSIHPLADGLLKCQQSNPVGYVTFRRHVIKEVVCKLFIDKNYTVLHTSIGQLLWFCEDLVQRTYCVETVKEEVLLLLPSMLTAAVLAENKAIVSDIIELLDEMCQKFDDRHLVVLCDAYQKVLSEILPLKNHRDSLKLVTLSLSKLTPGLQQRLKPILESTVENLEISSGKGMDKSSKIFVQKILESL